MKLARRATEWAAVTAASMPLGVVYSVILARALGPAGRGQYATFVTTVGILVGVLSLGAGVVARAEIASSPERTRGVHSNLFWFVTAVAAGLVVLAAVLPAWMDFGQPHWARYAIALCAAAGIYAGYGTLVLQGLGKFRWVNIMRLGRAGIDVAIAAIVLVVLKLELTGAIVGWTAAGVIAAAVMFLVITRTAGSPQKWDAAELGNSVRHGWKILVAGQAIALQTSFAILWLDRWGTSAEVGIFAIALGLAAQVSSFCGTLAIVASDKIAGPQRAESEAMVKRLARVLLAMAVPILFFGWLASGTVIVALYGDAFAPSATLFLILLFGTLVSQLTEVDAQYLIGQHWQTRTAMLLNLVNLALGAGMSFVLIPKWGATGAAIALSVAYALNAVMHHVWVKRTMGCTWREMLFLTKTDVERVRSGISINPRAVET